jgi:hypothetical protein
MLRRTGLALTAIGVLGALALGGVGVAQAAPAPEPEPAPPGAGAIIDSGTNFSEPDGSQAFDEAAGECVTVRLDLTGSIQFVSGVMTLWTGPDCATGMSRAIDEDQPDLAAAGFGKTRSIYVGDNEVRDPGTRVLLNDDRNNPDSSAVQGVSGSPGECVEVGRPNVASSAVQVDGVMRL